MRRPVAIILSIFIFPILFYAGSEMVTSKATPKEVYKKVSEAADYLARYGEGGVKELQNPDGPFVWRISFMMQAPDQPYQVISSIYDDNTSLENLDKISKTTTSRSD